MMQKKRIFISLFGTGINDEFKYDRYFSMIPNGPRKPCAEADPTAGMGLKYPSPPASAKNRNRWFSMG
jgi:hypothetical protein